MNATLEQTTLPGRPRDRRIDEAVLDATRAMLVTQGYSGVSLTAVAARAGTSTPAIYRRWPTKIHLVHEAAFPADLTFQVVGTDDLRSDVATMVRAAAELFGDPVVRAALPGLIGDLAQQPELHWELMARLWGTQLGEVQELLDRAADRGLARPGLQAQHLLSLIGGSALLGVLTPSGDTLDDPWVEAITTHLLQGMTP